jgi:long-chain acyl-CoA synthetase
MTLQLLLPVLIGAAIALCAWWMLQKPVEGQIKPLVDFNSQTRILPVRCLRLINYILLQDGSRICKYLKTDKLAKTLHSDTTTLYEAIRRGLRKSKNGPMLGIRNKDKPEQPYKWIHYNEVIDRSIDVAHAFQSLGLPAGQETFIGIYAKNRPEWVIVEHATYTFNNILVPLYETYGFDSCISIINQTEIQLVVCDSIEKVNGLMKKHVNCPCLRYLIVMVDEISSEDVQNAETLGIKLMTFAELETLGHEQPRMELQPPTPDDLATISYTSGTTGTP